MGPCSATISSRDARHRRGVGDVARLGDDPRARGGQRLRARRRGGPWRTTHGAAPRELPATAAPMPADAPVTHTTCRPGPSERQPRRRVARQRGR